MHEHIQHMIRTRSITYKCRRNDEWYLLYNCCSRQFYLICKEGNDDACCVVHYYIISTRLRGVLIEQLFPNFFLIKKNRKNRNISKVWKFKRGQNIWKASHSNIWKKKEEKYGNTKLREKYTSYIILWKFREKVLQQERPFNPCTTYRLFWGQTT